jgi:hypothetical protein
LNSDFISFCDAPALLQQTEQQDSFFEKNRELVKEVTENAGNSQKWLELIDLQQESGLTNFVAK